MVGLTTNILMSPRPPTRPGYHLVYEEEWSSLLELAEWQHNINLNYFLSKMTDWLSVVLSVVQSPFRKVILRADKN